MRVLINTSKYIWYLNEKPATNKVEFEIESSGLDFFYQPPLNEENKDPNLTCTETECKNSDGNVVMSRPENVVGSYAIYHSTKGGMNDANGKDYKVGKAFHIFRPHIIDVEGKETWGILKIKNGIYSVEIPQEFLDKAVYPIKSNDTFGYSGSGASATQVSANGLAGTYYTFAGTTGSTVDKITAYVYFDVDGHFKGVITLGSNDNIIANGVSNASAQHYAWDENWYDVTYTSKPSLTNAIEYELAIVAENTYVSLYYDSEVGYYQWIDISNNYTTPTNPTDGSSVADRRHCIYATYTPSGGGADIGVGNGTQVKISDK